MCKYGYFFLRTLPYEKEITSEGHSFRCEVKELGEKAEIKIETESADVLLLETTMNAHEGLLVKHALSYCIVN